MGFPAVASAPLVTTIADAGGVLIFTLALPRRFLNPNATSLIIDPDRHTTLLFPENGRIIEPFSGFPF